MVPDESNLNGLDADVLTPIVGRVLRIEDVTWGDPKKNFIVRYRGKLYLEDSAAAYDQLQESLRAMAITPVFRLEEGRHVVLLLKGTIQAKPSKIWVNGLMFLLTLLCVVLAGAIYAYQGPVAEDPITMLRFIFHQIGGGVPFAISLLSILLAHEFGHYLAARYHKTAVTLPYFIPLPLSPLGTMGAFIQIKEPPKNKRVMLDIGIAGPLAGLVVAIPVLLLGLWLSPVHQLPATLSPQEGLSLEGNSLLYLMAKWVVKGELLPAPASYGSLPPALYWARYVLTGFPIPWSGRDVLMHPIAWAGWAGLLVTALNLIPAGQLDGGHILYVLLGRKAGKIWPFIMFGLVGLGLVWSGWWLWAFLIFWLGRFYMEPLDQITPLDPRRKALAVFGILVFILVFTPVPLLEIMGGA